jgi:hypothetical protein
MAAEFAKMDTTSEILSILVVRYRTWFFAARRPSACGSFDCAPFRWRRALLLKLDDHSFDAPIYAKLIKMKMAKAKSPVIAAAQDQRRIANEPRRS